MPIIARCLKNLVIGGLKGLFAGVLVYNAILLAGFKLTGKGSTAAQGCAFDGLMLCIGLGAVLQAGFGFKQTVE